MDDQTILVITIILALVYSYGNGLNDAANALATVVSTRVLTPTTAVLLGGSMNMVGALTGTAVAKTIGKGIVDPEFMSQSAVMAAILSAVTWVFLATRLGFPVSVSHSLVAAVLGSGVATAGIPHGALVAEELDLPFIYVRSKVKEHGKQNQIEGVLAQLDFVKESAAIAISPVGGGPSSLVIYLVPDRNNQLEKKEILQIMQQTVR